MRYARSDAAAGRGFRDGYPQPGSIGPGDGWPGSPGHRIVSRPLPSPSSIITTADAITSPPYRLYLLGGASLIGPSGPIGALPHDDHLVAVLALLGAAPTDGAPPREVARAIWPDASSSEAEAALDEALQRLAALVEHPLVELGPALLRLDPALVHSDVRAYRGHLERGDRLAAAADYQGPFLDRFHLAGAAAFNQWMHATRGELALAFRELAAALASEAEAAGDQRAAARWWTRLVDADPWNPRAALQAMEGFEAMGAREAAVAVAEEYLARTGERLGREPDPAVRARLDQLHVAPPRRPARHGRRVAVLLGLVVVVGLVLVMLLS